MSFLVRTDSVRAKDDIG